MSGHGDDVYLRRVDRSKELAWCVVTVSEVRGSAGYAREYSVDFYESERDAKREAADLAAEGETVYVCRAEWQTREKGADNA